MITEVEDFFTKGCGRCARFATPDCATRLWIDGLQDLRAICRDMGLVETVKWGHPCYMHHGRNIALLGAFRGDFRLNFFEAALMTDPEHVLERQGPNAQTAGTLRFTDVAQVTQMAPVIRSYLAEAMGHAEAGTRAPRPSGMMDWPDELVAALDGDPELAEAFHALTPGRQKSYVIAIGSAKRPETRHSRIAAFRPKVIAGKGATER